MPLRDMQARAESFESLGCRDKLGQGRAGAKWVEWVEWVDWVE